MRLNTSKHNPEAIHMDPVAHAELVALIDKHIPEEGQSCELTTNQFAEFCKAALEIGCPHHPPSRTITAVNATELIMKSLEQIIALTKCLREARNLLAERVQNLNEQIDQLNARLLPGIRTMVSISASNQVLLHTAIEESRELFTAPRTITAHDYRIGLRKGTGGISWDDDERVIRLIENRLPEKADVLIKTKKTLQARALDDLDVSDLKKIGCTVADTADVVYIKPTDTVVDKLVKALVKAAVNEAQEEAA